jgi:antagonist of KipI
VTLKVLEGGLLTSIQDAGRRGWGHLGVPLSGAVDPDAFAAANLLVGNSGDAAAIEMTLVGATFAVMEPVTVGIAGGDLGGTVEATGRRRLAPGASYRLEPGDTVTFPGRIAGGARAYIALPGGVDVPAILGSRSTCLAAAFGGLDGRRLAAGDIIRRAAPDGVRAALRWPGEPDEPATEAAVRVVAPPSLVSTAPDDALDALIAETWSVAMDSDRMGIRLGGARLAASQQSVVSHGVTWGTIQLPPSGTPIVLLADAQPTGGYAVVAVVITADRGALGRLGPGDHVRFARVSLDDARAALRNRDAGLAAARDALVAARRASREEERWLDATGWAGG